MIMNPIVCKNCKTELQPNEILVGINNNGDLIRACSYCQDEVIIKKEQDK